MKKESEKAAKIMVETNGESSDSNAVDLSGCFLEDADGGNARYETRCIDDYVKNLEAKKSSDLESKERPKTVEVESVATDSDTGEDSSVDDDETLSETESEL